MAKELVPSDCRTLSALLRELGFSDRDLHGLVGAKRAMRPADLASNARLRLVADVLKLAYQIHGASARAWLTSPCPGLGGVLPSTLLRDPQNGPDLVKQELLNAARGTLA